MYNREYLSFSRKERNGILVLVGIIAAIIIVPRLISRGDMAIVENHDFEALLDQQSKTDSSAQTLPVRQGYPEIAGSGFNKSGRSYKGADHSRIPEKERHSQRKLRPVEINSADMAELIALPCIGSKLAARIVLFREKLGGFISVEQVRDVYGISDSAFLVIRPHLVCDTMRIQRLPINTVQHERLKSHPYVRWKLAEAIVNYRDQHGRFTRYEDLLGIHAMDSTTLSKLMPYLLFD